MPAAKPKIQKVCQYCGKLYEVIPANKDSKFCCKQCLYNSRKIIREKTCQYCGKQFIVKKKNQKYCCLKCATQAQQSCEDEFGHKKRLHQIWTNMKMRCFDSNQSVYSYYGGRGITVCEDWKNSFKQFYDWALNNGYQSHLTLDRIDVNGNYEPNNCRWTTYEVQSNNKTCNRFITYNNQTKTIGQWAKITGLTWDIIDWRLKKGWPIEQVLNFPRCKNQMDRINAQKDM